MSFKEKLGLTLLSVLVAIVVVGVFCDFSRSEGFARPRLTYFRDEATGLCFAQAGSFLHKTFPEDNYAFTNVPCEAIPELGAP